MPSYHVPDYNAYRKSISHELVSIKNRVRNIISDAHWGEEGRYKEVILTDMLRKHLPKSVSVGTGFIMGEGILSTQIDIIVYRNDIPVLFQQSDFVIVIPEAVLGIIEVKSSTKDETKIKEAIEKMARNAEMISCEAFCGIFIYEHDGGIRPAWKAALKMNKGRVKYLCLGPKLFLMHWYKPLNNSQQPVSHYGVYQMKDLAFGYFISNLIEDIYIATTHQQIPNSLKQMLYPIDGTKEARRLHDQDIICIDDSDFP